MGGKGSGRPKISREETLEVINEQLTELQGWVETSYYKMRNLEQLVRYYTDTVSKRR